MSYSEEMTCQCKQCWNHGVPCTARGTQDHDGKRYCEACLTELANRMLVQMHNQDLEKGSHVAEKFLEGVTTWLPLP